MIPFYEQKEGLLQITAGNVMNFPLHLHIYLEILYVAKGEILAKIGGSEYKVQKGQLALIFPNIVHEYRTESSPDDTEFSLIVCHPFLTGDCENMLKSCQPANPVIPEQDLHKDVAYAISALTECSNDKQLAKLFIQLILMRTTPRLTLISNQGLLPHDLTVLIISYISEHYQEPLTLQILAKKFGVSRYRLSRIFSNIVRVQFNQYINTLRIDKAKSLLHNTNQDILSVGLNCGFENQQTFNRTFKTICGLTPKEYRKMSLEQKGSGNF